MPGGREAVCLPRRESSTKDPGAKHSPAAGPRSAGCKATAPQALTAQHGTGRPGGTWSLLLAHGGTGQRGAGLHIWSWLRAAGSRRGGSPGLPWAQLAWAGPREMSRCRHCCLQRFVPGSGPETVSGWQGHAPSCSPEGAGSRPSPGSSFPRTWSALTPTHPGAPQTRGEEAFRLQVNRGTQASGTPWLSPALARKQLPRPHVPFVLCPTTGWAAAAMPSCIASPPCRLARA